MSAPATPAPRVAPGVRKVLKQAAGAAARFAPRPDVGTRRVVLCYHSVHPTVHYRSATPEGFAEHLDWLRVSCDVVPLAALTAGPNRAGRPQVALTFDDGYADNHHYAFPLLAARRLPATFFVTVGFLERDPAVMERLSRIWQTPAAELAPLAWREVAEMRAAGMAFGSHTWSHPNLAELDHRRLLEELRRSKATLEDRTGERVAALAYPFGKLRHNVGPPVFAAAAAAGYERGYVSLPRAVASSDAPLRIPRFGVGDDDVASLGAKVRGEIDWHATVHQRLPARVSRVLFPLYR